MEKFKNKIQLLTRIKRLKEVKKVHENIGYSTDAILIGWIIQELEEQLKNF